MRKPVDVCTFFLLSHYLRPLSDFTSYFEGIFNESQSKDSWSSFHGSLWPGILRSPSVCMLINRNFSNSGFVLPVVGSDWISEQKPLGEKCEGRPSETEVFSWSGFFASPAHCKADVLFPTGKQRVILTHENTALHRAVRSISQISNATTSCSKGEKKKSFWSKAKQRNFWHVSQMWALLWYYEVYTAEAPVWSFQLKLCNLCLYVLPGTTKLLFLPELVSAAFNLFSPCSYE